MLGGWHVGKKWLIVQGNPKYPHVRDLSAKMTLNLTPGTQPVPRAAGALGGLGARCTTEGSGRGLLTPSTLLKIDMEPTRPHFLSEVFFLGTDFEM